jgi:hypothetical protein
MVDVVMASFLVASVNSEEKAKTKKTQYYQMIRWKVKWERETKHIFFESTQRGFGQKSFSIGWSDSTIG